MELKTDGYLEDDGLSALLSCVAGGQWLIFFCTVRSSEVSLRSEAVLVQKKLEISLMIHEVKLVRVLMVVGG